MHLRIITATALTLSIVACGDDTPTDEDYDDVASVTAALVADDGGETDGMEDAIDNASGESPGIYTRAGDGSLVGARGQIDYSFELTCQDAAGNEQDICTDTTDSAQLVVAWNGEVDTARRYASLDRSGSWSLSGLTTDVATFAGNGAFAVDSEFEALYRPVMRSLSLEYTAQYNDVTFDRIIRRPVGGSISYTVDVARTEARRFGDVEAEFEVDVNVAFSPDGTATIELDGDRRYVLTLDDGEVTPVE